MSLSLRCFAGVFRCWEPTCTCRFSLQRKPVFTPENTLYTICEVKQHDHVRVWVGVGAQGLHRRIDSFVPDEVLQQKLWEQIHI